MFTSRIFFALALITTPIVAVSDARADDKAVAREAYRNGSRLYDLGRFKESLAEFERAYLNYEDSAILFNIAQCHRQLDNKIEAIRFFKTYLRKQPDAPNAAQVRQSIADLELALKNQPAPLAPTPALTTPPPSTTEVATPPRYDQPRETTVVGVPYPPRETTPPATTSPPPTTTDVVVTAPPPAKPAYKKWWVWTIVGVGVVGLGVGLGVGLTAGRKSEPTFDRVTFP